MMATKTQPKAEDKDVRDAVQEHLKQEERSLRWLSIKTGINYNTLYSKMVHRTAKLTEDNVTKINAVLNTTFVHQK